MVSRDRLLLSILFATLCVQGAIADVALEPEPLIDRLDHMTRAKVILALTGLVMLGAMRYGAPGQRLPNMAAVQKLTDAYADAALAMTRMSAPNNHIQVAIKARNVIETNGEQDGDLVRFRWSAEEFMRLVVKRDDREPAERIYYAVIEY